MVSGWRVVKLILGCMGLWVKFGFGLFLVLGFGVWIGFGGCSWVYGFVKGWLLVLCWFRSRFSVGTKIDVLQPFKD